MKSETFVIASFFLSISPPSSFEYCSSHCDIMKSWFKSKPEEKKSDIEIEYSDDEEGIIICEIIMTFLRLLFLSFIQCMNVRLAPNFHISRCPYVYCYCKMMSIYSSFE